MLPDSRGLWGVCLSHLCSVSKCRFLTLCKLRVFHFQTHLGKQVGCLLSLGNWLHYSRYKCKEVTLLKETMSSDLHTKSSRHRTPAFLMCLRLCHLPHREKSVQPRPLWKASVNAKCVFSGLGHSREVRWAWTCHLTFGAEALLSPREIPVGWQRVQHD